MTLAEAEAHRAPHARGSVGRSAMTVTAIFPSCRRSLVDDAVRAALAEDLGRAGDITSAATIPRRCAARRRRSSPASPACSPACRWPSAAFRAARSDGALRRRMLDDGDALAAGDVVAASTATPARSSRPSASRSTSLPPLRHRHRDRRPRRPRRAHAARASCDTRKTTPGLRAFEKYAVRCGGGVEPPLRPRRRDPDQGQPHRRRRRRRARRSARARAPAGHLVKIEVEVDTLDQLARGARPRGPTSCCSTTCRRTTLREAVRMVAGRARDRGLRRRHAWRRSRRSPRPASTCISSGWITHSAPALDLALDVVVQAQKEKEMRISAKRATTPPRLAART